MEVTKLKDVKELNKEELFNADEYVVAHSQSDGSFVIITGGDVLTVLTIVQALIDNIPEEVRESALELLTDSLKPTGGETIN